MPTSVHRTYSFHTRRPTVNLFSVGAETARVSLSNGYTTTIDADRVDDVRRQKWRAVQVGAGFVYAIGKVRGTDGVIRNIFLHRFLTKAPKGLQVDHINHDTLDNRSCNLRLCTDGENKQNRRGAAANSTTGVRGVSSHHQADGTPFYRARVTVGSRTMFDRCYEYTSDGLRRAESDVTQARREHMPLAA